MVDRYFLETLVAGGHNPFLHFEWQKIGTTKTLSSGPLPALWRGENACQEGGTRE